MELHDTKITGRSQIERLLTHLQDLQCPLALVLGDQGQHQANILAVNAANDYLLVSGARLGPDRPLPAADQAVRAEARFHGECARFQSQVMEAADLAGKALLRIRLPQHIDYQQRRAYFRVALDPDTRIAVTLIDERHGSLFGTLEDLSLGGMAALVERQPDDSPIGVDLCLLQLPGGAVFHSPLQITHTCTVPNDARIRVGARFVNPLPAQRRKLERFIRQLEREQLKQSVG